MNKNNSERPLMRLTKLASFVLISLGAVNAHAGGFSVFGEGNGRNSGDFGAGVAAEASDASTLYYNPAGMINLEGEQLVVGATIVTATSKIQPGSTISVSNNTTGPLVYTTSIAGEKAYASIPIPALFYTKKVNPNLAWGIGVYVPFGLETSWAESAPTRYSATKSNLQIINVSPAIASKLNDKVSFGAGFDIQYASVELNSVIGLPTCAQAGICPNPNFLDSTVRNKGTSVGFGAHAGFMVQATTDTRLGVNYQSQVQHRFSGDSVITGRLADPNFTNPAASVRNGALFSDPANMPDQITASGIHNLNEKVSLMATAAFIRWSSIKQIVMNGVQAGPAGVTATVTLPQNYRDTWRLVAGGKYQVNEKVSIRGGVGYDQTPVNNVDRNLRLPDSDRIAVAIGGHYQVNKSVGIDLGWTHLFFDNTAINNTLSTTSNIGRTTTVTVNAGMKAHADLFGGQLTWQIA